jgi:hypothetical protein
MAKMPSEQTRLDRIARNYKKLPKKQAQNIKKSERGAEIIRHATGTAAGARSVAHHRPQSRVRKG